MEFFVPKPNQTTALSDHKPHCVFYLRIHTQVSASRSKSLQHSGCSKDPTCDPSASGTDYLTTSGRERTTGHRRTTGPSVSSVIWATVQPGRNHGKGPGKRWVYCPSFLLDVTDAHCLTGGLVFFFFVFLFIWFSGNILSEHPMYSVTLLDRHGEVRLLCGYVSYWRRSYPNLFIYVFNVFTAE